MVREFHGNEKVSQRVFIHRDELLKESLDLNGLGWSGQVMHACRSTPSLTTGEMAKSYC